MDRTGANFFAAVQSMRERLGANAVPIQLPIGAEENFKGVIDLVEMQAIVYKDDLGQQFETTEIPAELAEQAHEYHHELIEAVSDFDDEVLEATSRTRARSPPSRSCARLRAGTVADAITPVLLGSRLQEQGRPAAARRGHRLPAVPARRPAGRRASIRRTRARPSAPPTLDAPFSALAFKVMSDPFVGKLTYFRVYSGKLKAGDRVLNATTGKTERVGRMLQMHANHREEREEIGAGEIAAGVGLKQTTTGDTLSAEATPIVLESMTFPEPVISVAVEPKTKADQDKLGTGLPGSPRRTRPSASAPTRRRARRSSPAWASCTSRSSSTA